MKIEGVPDGWELVKLAPPEVGQWFVNMKGEPELSQYDITSFWPIIRRIEPHCTWQHGQFKDGWVAEDSCGLIWYRDKPEFIDQWRVHGGPMSVIGRCLVNPPVFRSDLPWNERIQQVGPTIESTLRGET